MFSDQKRRSRGQPHSRLAAWFGQLRGPLRRFIARRSVAPADFEDVAQEVFLRLLRYDRQELVEDPRSYLFKIAANVASEWSMRARQRLPHSAEWLDDLADTVNVIDDIESAQRASALHAALAALSPRAREVMRLHFSEGLTHQSIANQLHVSQRIVKREIINACAALRMTLSNTPESPASPTKDSVSERVHQL